MSVIECQVSLMEKRLKGETWFGRCSSLNPLTHLNNAKEGTKTTYYYVIYSSCTSLCDHVSVGLLSGYCHFCFCRAFNNSTIVVRDNSQSSCRGAKLFHPVLYDSLFPDPLFISLLFFFFVAADGDGDVDMGTPSRLN